MLCNNKKLSQDKWRELIVHIRLVYVGNVCMCHICWLKLAAVIDGIVTAQQSYCTKREPCAWAYRRWIDHTGHICYDQLEHGWLTACHDCPNHDDEVHAEPTCREWITGNNKGVKSTMIYLCMNQFGE